MQTDGLPEYAPLDRAGVRERRVSSDEWERDMHTRYHLIAEAWNAVAHAEPQTEGPILDHLRNFEISAFADTEWVAGYHSGLEDADRMQQGLEIEGPGSTKNSPPKMDGVPLVTMTSQFARTRSAASSGRRSLRLSAQRSSIIAFLPST